MLEAGRALGDDAAAFGRGTLSASIEQEITSPLLLFIVIAGSAWARTMFSIAPAALKPLASMVHEMSEMLAGDERVSDTPFCLLRTLLIAVSSARRARNSARVTPTMLPIPILQLFLAAHLHLVLDGASGNGSRRSRSDMEHDAK